ncbi:hypothetical protein [Tenacibaculum piscium]|uniref:hypothetical protein n=1 Tax=Tenacibaculum piscium TaxID=1458515 RepID=UPI001F194D5B|nr:hypothetical protein [Tenacibaculum piscium]
MELSDIQEKILIDLNLLKDKNLKVRKEVFRIPDVYKNQEIDGKTEEIKIADGYKVTKIYVEYSLKGEWFTFLIETLENLESLRKIIDSKDTYLSNYLARYNDKYIDVLVFKINTDKIFQNDFKIETSYNNYKLEIEVSREAQENLLTDFIEIYNGSQELKLTSAIVRIKGLTEEYIKTYEKKIETLLNSIFFDIKCVRGEYLEVYNYSLLNKRLGLTGYYPKGKYSNNYKFKVKELIPELVDYFKVAERINYLPFKFLCYYHILEYFLDKSAQLTIKRKISNLLYKPDFEINSDYYINEISETFKYEGDRLKSDKIKIERVLQEFIDSKELFKFIENLEFNEHFFQNQSLNFSEVITLESIKNDTNAKFYKSLTNRIYSIRCSIVHSNPDFGKKDAVPFISSHKNLLILEKEIYLLEEIAKNLIINSRV